MKCSILLGFVSLNRTFNLSPHENIHTIALITIHNIVHNINGINDNYVVQKKETKIYETFHSMYPLKSKMYYDNTIKKIPL